MIIAHFAGVLSNLSVGEITLKPLPFRHQASCCNIKATQCMEKTDSQHIVNIQCICQRGIQALPLWAGPGDKAEKYMYIVGYNSSYRCSVIWDTRKDFCSPGPLHETNLCNRLSFYSIRYSNCILSIMHGGYIHTITYILSVRYYVWGILWRENAWRCLA